MTLVGYWPMKENSGNARDYSGRENEVESYGGVSKDVQAITGGTGWSFDGEDDYAQAPDLSIYHTFPLTYAVWVFLPNNFYSGSNGGIMEKGPVSDSPGMGLGRSDGKLVLNAINTDGEGLGTQQVNTTNPSEGNWHHLVGVWTGKTSDNIKLYVDGTIEDSSAPETPGTDPTEKLAFATWGNSTSSNVKCTICEARIYNRVLTESEIQYLYQVAERGRKVTHKKNR